MTKHRKPPISLLGDAPPPPCSDLFKVDEERVKVMKRKRTRKRAAPVIYLPDDEEKEIWNIIERYRKTREHVTGFPYQPIPINTNPKTTKNWKSFRKMYSIATLNSLDPGHFFECIINHFVRKFGRFPYPASFCCERALDYVMQQRMIEDIDPDQYRTEDWQLENEEEWKELEAEVEENQKRLALPIKKRTTKIDYAWRVISIILKKISRDRRRIGRWDTHKDEEYTILLDNEDSDNYEKVIDWLNGTEGKSWMVEHVPDLCCVSYIDCQRTGESNERKIAFTDSEIMEMDHFELENAFLDRKLTAREYQTAIYKRRK